MSSELSFLSKWIKKRHRKAIKETNGIWSNICYARAHLPKGDEKPSIYSNAGLLIEIVDNLLDYISWREEIYDNEIENLKRRIEEMEEASEEE